MLCLLPMGMPSAGSHRLAPSRSTVSGTQGCPKGQRHAAQRECFEAVFSVTFAEELELRAKQLKVVTDDAKGPVPPFCSYNRASKTAVFNTYSNKAAGTGGSYQQVCVEEEASTQGCPEGRRNAAEHECLAAVLAVALVEGLELLDKQLKTVNNGANGAVSPGCSYSRQSMTAVFNSNKAAGNSSLYQRVCVEDEAAPVTVSVRLCEAMHMGSANRNTNGYASRETDPARTGYAHNESAFVQIFQDSFAPTAGAQPDLVFLPMECGWEASQQHSAADPAPRLGYFALAQSPWLSERGPWEEERLLIRQQWPERMVVMSTDVPAHTSERDGSAEYTQVRSTHPVPAKEWPTHSTAHGLTIPYHSDPPPLVAPEERPALATFVGSCSKETGSRLPCQLMDECLAVSATGECVFVSDEEDVGQHVFTGSRFALMPWTDTTNRRDVFGALMQGAIPVIFDNTTFGGYWPYAPLEQFAVQVPPSARTASGGVLQFLRNLPASEVTRLLASVQRVRRRFYLPRTASLHQEGDAVDVIVRTIVEHYRGVLGIHAWHGGLPKLP